MTLAPAAKFTKFLELTSKKIYTVPDQRKREAFRKSQKSAKSLHPNAYGQSIGPMQV